VSAVTPPLVPPAPPAPPSPPVPPVVWANTDEDAKSIVATPKVKIAAIVVITNIVDMFLFINV
jgi:hypothetical protein